MAEYSQNIANKGLGAWMVSWAPKKLQRKQGGRQELLAACGGIHS